LIGIKLDFANEISYKELFKKLKEDIKDNDADYYFLMYNKTQKNDIRIHSLKHIGTLVPNGNNLPFQCNWNDNRIYIENRSFDKYKKFVLTAYGNSITLRADACFHFRKHFPEFTAKS
jgi:hypothetical protein